MFFGFPQSNKQKSEIEKSIAKPAFWIKSSLFVLIYFTRIYEVIFWFLRKLNKRRIGLILTYHFLRNENADQDAISGLELGITKQKFHKEVLFLKKHFMIVPVEELARQLASGGSFDNHYVSITFDDAYNSVYERVFPILKEYDIPATIFVPCAYVGGNQDFWWISLSTALKQISKDDLEKLKVKLKGSKFEKEVNDILNTKELTNFENRKKFRSQLARYISNLNEYGRQELIGIMRQCFDCQVPHELQVAGWSRLREMSQNGMEIASHTVSHPDLTSLENEDIEWELEESKRVISEKLSQKVEGVAFPYGETNSKIQKKTRELGYSYAVINETGTVMPSDDRYSLKRIDFSSEIPFYYFVCRILKALILGK